MVASDGRAFLSYGPDPVGYLAYTPDGFMFVTMAHRTAAGWHAKLVRLDT
jgi:hypothetical protein